MPLSKFASSAFAATLSIATIGLAQPASAQSDPSPIELEGPGLDPAKLDLATQIIDLGYPANTREALFFDTMDQLLVQLRTAIEPTLPDDDTGALAILDDWIAEHLEELKGVLRKHIPAIMQGMVNSYARIFSAEELTDILAFVRTSSGQRYFALSPKVLADDAFASANQKYLEEVLLLSGPAQERLEDRLQEYFEDEEAGQPPVT